MDAIAHMWYEYVLKKHCPDAVHFTTRVFRNWVREPQLVLIVLKATSTSIWVPFWLCLASHYIRRQGWI
jgi:hypothetical protein